MYEIDKRKFGAFVSALRKEKGLTQKELAQKLFISDKAVSKWETAASIPDTALLIPLAELLGVTVTELLTCERNPGQEPMDPVQVESAVKTALAYSEEKPARAYQFKSKWPFVYFCAVIFGWASVLVCFTHQILVEPLLTTMLLSTVFGAYFCLFVKTKLPAFYDQNRCNLFYDGPFRMNIPGVTFNNSNWPHVILAGRLWACLSISCYPLLHICMYALSPAFWLRANLYIFLLLFLGGLFLPMYIVGKKYE